jgi:hypothetical protein
MFGYFLFAIVINILLAYTRFFIVLGGMKAFDAVIASANMTLNNPGITFRLYATLLIVYVRTIVTVVIFILLPFLLSTILTLVSASIIQLILIGVVGVITLGFFVFLSHLSSVLEIFVETLWYRAFIDNRERVASSSSDHQGETNHHDAGHHGVHHGGSDHHE